MEDGQILIIVVVVLVVIFLIYYCGGSDQKSKYIGTPVWAMESLSVNEGDPITLSFTYNYGLQTYRPDQTNFSVVILDCDGGCPVLNCGAVGTTAACDPNSITQGGKIMWTTTVAGESGSIDAGAGAYDIPVPNSGLYPIGTYVAYVMAFLKENPNVQSQPVPSDQIIVSPPEGSPPLLRIASPLEGTQFASTTASVTVVGEISESSPLYDSPYKVTLTVKDVTLGDSDTVVYRTETGYSMSPSLTFQITSGLYSGQFSATLTTTAQYLGADDKAATTESAPVSIYIKLPTPTNVSLSQ